MTRIRLTAQSPHSIRGIRIYSQISITCMTFPQFVAQFGALINAVLMLLTLAAVLLFMWGLLRFMWIDAASADASKKAKDLMFWGVIAMFVLFAMGGILNFFAEDIFGTTVFQGAPPERSDCIPTASGIGCAM